VCKPAVPQPSFLNFVLCISPYLRFQHHRSPIFNITIVITIRHVLTFDSDLTILSLPSSSPIADIFVLRVTIVSARQHLKTLANIGVNTPTSTLLRFPHLRVLASQERGLLFFLTISPGDKIELNL